MTLLAGANSEPSVQRSSGILKWHTTECTGYSIGPSARGGDICESHGNRRGAVEHEALECLQFTRRELPLEAHQPALLIICHRSKLLAAVFTRQRRRAYTEYVTRIELQGVVESVTTDSPSRVSECFKHCLHRKALLRCVLFSWAPHRRFRRRVGIALAWSFADLLHEPTRQLLNSLAERSDL